MNCNVCNRSDDNTFEDGVCFNCRLEKWSDDIDAELVLFSKEMNRGFDFTSFNEYVREVEDREKIEEMLKGFPLLDDVYKSILKDMQDE